MNLAETARVTSAAAALEQATFELLGGWVSSVPEPAARVLLAEHALHHAWHARLWRERVPEAVGLDLAGGQMSDGPQPLIVTLLARVAELSGEGPVNTVDRLTATSVALAGDRAAAYEAVRLACSPASDGPVLRVLTLVTEDQRRHRAEAVALLAGLHPGQR